MTIYITVIELSNLKIEICINLHMLQDIALNRLKASKEQICIYKVNQSHAELSVNFFHLFINFNSSFTDFPLIKLHPETDFFLSRIPEVAPGHNTDYSYAHIWFAIFNHACNEIYPLQVCICEIGKVKVKVLN